MEGDRDPRAGRHIKQLLRDAGFSDVQEQIFHIPIGGWHRGESVFSFLVAEGNGLVWNTRRVPFRDLSGQYHDMQGNKCCRVRFES